MADCDVILWSLVRLTLYACAFYFLYEEYRDWGLLYAAAGIWAFNWLVWLLCRLAGFK
jgi:hypothetical protein